MLTPGQKLGPYEIDSPLGAGGMGEVYRARDTRLERTVAIKVLPSHLSSNPDLKQRFEREAKAISSLNHPRICQLYDVGSQDGVDFLVMEYLEGETLAKRLEKGALPLEQVLKIGADLAEALDKAHRAGIIHRDLKPGNVMLTKSGAKLMDFGLAKAAPGGFAGGTATAPLLSAAMTMTSPSPRQSPLTSAGAVVGTIQYMSPEQIEGKEADARSDIFALGAVIYEMATGRRAFEGKSQLSVASAILEKDPEPLSATQPTAPPAFDLVIRTCVAKDPDERFQTAHDLMLQLRWLAQPSLSSSAAAAQPAMPAKSPRTRAIWATVAILALVAAGLAGYLFAPSGQSSRVTRTLLEPPDKIVLDPMGDFGGPPVLSPQGDRIVFCAHGPDSPRALWIRSLESFSAQRLEGTDGAINPFWSPDGRFIGFFANQKLYRIPATGGVPSVLAEAPNARGGSWGRNDIILFAPDIQSSILQVSANGGKPVAATKVDVNKHTTHRWPVFLPDGKHFLYLATNHNGGRPEDNGVYFVSLDGKDNRMLVPSDAGGDYASGYLLYHAGTALMAQPFDPASGKLAGEAVSVVERVRQDPGVWRTVFTVSQNGLLAYQPGSAEVAGSQLAWVDRSGKQVGMVGERGPYMDPRISPDGKRLAVSIGDPQREIWICDLERGTRTRLTFSQAGAARLQPGWSPDGKTIVYTGSVLSVGGGKALLYSKPASGTGGETLTQGNDSSGGGYFYGSWSPDGKLFVYLKRFGPSDNTVYARPASGGEEFKVVGPASPRANVIFYRISPNGRWIAYVSDESGRDEVYLAPFPRGEGKWQVTSGGGDFPSWRGDSKEIYFLSVNSISMLACSIAEKGNELEIGPQQALFTAHFAALGTFFDAAADGKRFILNLAGDDAPTPVHLVTNWPLELKKK